MYEHDDGRGDVRDARTHTGSEAAGNLFCPRLRKSRRRWTVTVARGNRPVGVNKSLNRKNDPSWRYVLGSMSEADGGRADADRSPPGDRSGSRAGDRPDTTRTPARSGNVVSFCRRSRRAYSRRIPGCRATNPDRVEKFMRLWSYRCSRRARQHRRPASVR